MNRGMFGILSYSNQSRLVGHQFSHLLTSLTILSLNDPLKLSDHQCPPSTTYPKRKTVFSEKKLTEFFLQWTVFSDLGWSCPSQPL